MAIFNSYVSLPEGTTIYGTPHMTIQLQTTLHKRSSNGLNHRYLLRTETRSIQPDSFHHIIP